MGDAGETMVNVLCAGEGRPCSGTNTCRVIEDADLLVGLSGANDETSKVLRDGDGYA